MSNILNLARVRNCKLIQDCHVGVSTKVGGETQ